MKPRRLTMQAFGSFLERTVVDFDRLGPVGLYLVSGATGAGKTTIFDAITYALYGEASGSDRSSGNFRSLNAGPEVPTSVELLFSYRDKDYRILRTPSYERRKQRGEGTTVCPATVELELPDRTVLTKESEVRNAIAQILGLSSGQFKQVIMIAQGEFKRFLSSDTDTKRGILRTLFQTEKYSTFIKRLGEENRSAKDEYGKADTAIKADIKTVIPGDEALDSENMTYSEVIDHVASMNESDATSEEALKASLDALDEKKTRTGLDLSKARERAEVVAKIEENNRKLEKFDSELGKQTEIKIGLEGRKEEIEGYKAQSLIIRSSLPDYDSYEKTRKDSESRKKKLGRALEDQKANADAIEINAKALGAVLKKLEGHKDDESRKAELAICSGKADNEVKALSELSKKASDCALKEKRSKVAAEAFCKERDKYKTCDSMYSSALESFLASQAGILAESLKEGEPCPVCGSAVHPHKASRSDSSPTQEKLDELKADRDSAEACFREAGSKASSARSVLEEAQKALSDALAERGVALEALDGELRKAKAVLSALKTELSKVNEALDEKAWLLERHEKLEEEKTLLQTDKDSIASDVSALNAEVASLDATLKEKKQKLVYGSKSEAEKRIGELESSVSAYSSALEKCEAAIARCNEKKSQIAGTLSALASQLEAMPEMDSASLQKEYDDLCAEIGTVSEKRDCIAARLGVNRPVLERIRSRYRDVRDKAAKADMVRNLYETVSGTIAGTERINLETYVQMRDFERVLYFANRRFLYMTDNQFEFKRRSGEGRGNSQVGLDIDIIDHHNGKTRDISTLSGGESFQASLSLALGLSDEIQHRVGGIRLDTLFVDEGFGSLDSDFLKLALSTLSGMASEISIGIISHVESLQNSIERQLLVSKNSDGNSSVRIVD